MSSYSNVLLNDLVLDLSLGVPTLRYEDLAAGNCREAAWPGITGKEFACLALVDSFLKKFEDEKTDTADKRALEKFVACNTRCEGFAAIDDAAMDEITTIAMGEFKKSFWNFFYKSCDSSRLGLDDVSLRELSLSGHYMIGIPVSILDDLTEIAESGRTGPGASIGAVGQSFYHKMAASCVSCSDESLYSLYKRETTSWPLWSETEKIRSTNLGRCKVVPGSKLQYVPKSRDISRTICTEPSLNMFFQQGVRDVLERQLRRRYGIDLQTQPAKNQALACIGSRNGAYGTIDLSSASDTISIGLLKEICPPEVFRRLMSLRSPTVKLPSGEIIQLHMVSSMGNAFTFPLQTILFSSIVVGVYEALNIKVEYPYDSKIVGEHRLGNFAVFGDDIIVRREAYNLVIDLLRRCGFEVNSTKSFNEGPFRESCGKDYFQGYNVRGVYCQSLKTKHDVFSLINRLNVWSANHGIALPRTLNSLMDRIGWKFNPIPPWEDDSAGVKVPLDLADPTQLFISEEGSILYNRYVAEPRKVDLLNVGMLQNVGKLCKLDKAKVKNLIRHKSTTARERKRLKALLRQESRSVLNNQPGILLAALGGYLHEGYVHERVDSPFFKKRAAVALGWDYIDPCHSSFTNDGWQRWKLNFVRANLGNGLLEMVGPPNLRKW